MSADDPTATSPADQRAERRSFFARPLTDEYANEWAAILAKPPETSASEGYVEAYLLFRFGELTFAMPAGAVRSIADPVPVCRLPQYGDSAFLGLVAIGGEVLPCCSLSRLMQLPDGETPAGTTRLIVMEAIAGESWVFPADAVLSVVKGTAQSVEYAAAGSWESMCLQIEGSEEIVLLQPGTVAQAMADAVA